MGTITITIFDALCAACGGTGKGEGQPPPLGKDVPDNRPDCETCEGFGDIEEEEHELPARFDVCGHCEGHGTHLHEAIREHAYTREEFADAFDDDESRAEYFKRGGMYDVTCETCKGARVVPVVDEERLTPAQKVIFAMYEKSERVRAQYDAEDRQTRRMENGGY